MKQKYSNDEIERLILLISKLPGFGPKSAGRVVLHLLKRKDQLMIPIAEALLTASDKIITCNDCGNIDLNSPCSMCSDTDRDISQLCVVEDVADLWALEKSGVFNGYYHVLGGNLSAINGIGPDELNIKKLVERVNDKSVKEVILALSSTVDGQTTAHYVADCLANSDIEVSRLGQGVPVGGELDYMDEGTIAAAISSRQKL
jgi:recombination protein RecR